MSTSSTATRSGRASAPPERHRRWVPAVVAATIAAIVFGLLGYWIGQPASPDPTSIEGITEALTADYEAEHRRMTQELTGAVTTVYAELMPVLAEMNEVLPVARPDAGTAGTPQQVDGWLETTAAATQSLTNFGLGAPSFNATHGSLLGAVRQLDATARTYAEALETAGPVSQRLVSLAASQRNAAADLWAVGAEQLDELNIAADLGHVHMFLPVTGDPDSIPLEFQGTDDH